MNLYGEKQKYRELVNRNKEVKNCNILLTATINDSYRLLQGNTCKRFSLTHTYRKYNAKSRLDKIKTLFLHV